MSSKYSYVKNSSGQSARRLYACECNGGPELRILPKTETALTVEQYHRLLWNCLRHARMATTAPDLMASINSMLRRQMCFCLRTSPTSRSHSFSARMCLGAPVDAIDLQTVSTPSQHNQGWNCRGVGELNPPPSSCLQTLIFE